MHICCRFNLKKEETFFQKKDFAIPFKLLIQQATMHKKIEKILNSRPVEKKF